MIWGFVKRNYRQQIIVYSHYTLYYELSLIKMKYSENFRIFKIFQNFENFENF
jgi:hypothetical protein